MGGVPEGLSDAAQEEIAALVRRYPRPRAAVLPVLHIVQREIGWMPPAAKEYVARTLGMAPVQVEELCTFYTMIKTRPTGRYLVQLCRTLPCVLCGAERLRDSLTRRLGIGVGETTPDGKFTLVEVECLASCDTAPVLQVNDQYHEMMTEERLERLLASLP